MKKRGDTPWYKRWWAIILFVVAIITFSVFLLVLLIVIGALLYAGATTPVKETLSVTYKTSDFLSSVDNVTESSGLNTVIIRCGFSNAYFNGSNRRIVMCEELGEELSRLFYPDVKKLGLNESDTQRVLQQKISNTLWVVYSHERSHALIAMYKLPITGREEDVADQISFVYASSAQQERVLDAATWYLLRSKEWSVNERSFYDEHALDAQRYYNLICWVYGKNPDKFAYLVKDGILPESRAERCPYESYQVTEGVKNLLAPIYKQG